MLPPSYNAHLTRLGRLLDLKERSVLTEEAWMKKFALLLVMLVVSAVLFAGCATVRGPALGFVYTDTKSSIAPTSNQSGNRVGEACATSYFGLVATGDASIEAA